MIRVAITESNVALPPCLCVFSLRSLRASHVTLLTRMLVSPMPEDIAYLHIR